MLVRMWSKGNTNLLLTGLQTGTTTVEISMVVPWENENQSTSRSSYMTLEPIPKGHFILTQTQLLNHVNC